MGVKGCTCSSLKLASYTGAGHTCAHKVKLDLLPKFSGKPSELTGQVFLVEQYCGMVGLARTTDMV